jgi:glycine cleavage system H lipoate-binding protein
MWEIGCDLRYWLLSGQMVSLDLPAVLPAVVAGETFGRILLGDGRTDNLVAPMTGRVREMNQRANEVLAEFVRENLAEGWLMWLVRIAPIEGQKI